MSVPADRVVAGLIGGRYEISGLIASGGMGTVYRARDSVLGRTVALKVLKAGGDAAFVERFRTEATNAARLGHPNIVAVYDFGNSDGVPYMAMEYVDGQTLREVLQARSVLRPELAARIAHQVALALEHARRNGIVHRDVKPDNILITHEGTVKVADFGLSRALAESRATQAGVLLGTAHYLSPEQVRGQEADHRSDIYSLGVVLYEMLTGRPPFTGDSPAAIAYRRLNEEVPPPIARNPSVPRALDTAVARATALRAEQRYPTAGAFAEALRAVAAADETDLGMLVHRTQAIPMVAQETVALHRETRTVARRKGKRRRAVILAAVATAALVLVGLFAGPLARATVPAVAGLTQEEAKATLEREGLTVDPVLRNDAEIPAGTVIAQDPAEGVRIRTGSTVKIVVSLGPELLAVTPVEGMRYARAERLLEAEGFTVSRLDVFHDSVAKLRVVRQDPGAGLLLERGSKVTLEVSKGPEIVKVPNVVGITEDSAKNDLRAAGLVVVVKRSSSPTVPRGEVIATDPEAGERVEKGTRVTLTVSKGAPMVRVPDLRCMTRRQAEDALAAKGFEGRFRGSGTLVVDQSPAPGGTAPKGSTVTAYLGFGSFC